MIDDYAFRQLKTYVENLIRIGKVTEINREKATAKVAFKVLDNLVSYDLQVLQLRTWGTKDYIMPAIGEHVVCLFLSTGVEDGLIIGSIFDDTNAPNISGGDKVRQTHFPDGTEITYNAEAHTYHIDVKGDVIIDATGDIAATAGGDASITAGGDITLTTPQKITINAPTSEVTGTLIVQGLLTMNGGFTSSGGGAVTGKITGKMQATEIVNDDGLDFATHKHNGVQSGTQTSGTPTM